MRGRSRQSLSSTHPLRHDGASGKKKMSGKKTGQKTSVKNEKKPKGFLRKKNLLSRDGTKDSRRALSKLYRKERQRKKPVDKEGKKDKLGQTGNNSASSIGPLLLSPRTSSKRLAPSKEKSLKIQISKRMASQKLAEHSKKKKPSKRNQTAVESSLAPRKKNQGSRGGNRPRKAAKLHREAASAHKLG